MFPLFFPLRQSKKVEAAKEGMEEANQNLLQTETSLRTSWEGEYQLAKKLLDVYNRYHSDTVLRYFASYKAMLGSLPSSRVTLLDVLDSYRAYLDVSIKEAESYRDLMKSVSMLIYLAGEELNHGDTMKEKITEDRNRQGAKSAKDKK